MKKNDLTNTINEAKSFIKNKNEPQNDINFGFSIVVLDRGFVYVGDTEKKGEFLKMTNAKNIRYWGTTKGLGELVLSGPTSSTKLDDVGTIAIPLKAVISIHETEEDLWKI